MPTLWSSNPGSVKSYTALQTVRQCFNIYASDCGALALCCGDGAGSAVAHSFFRRHLDVKLHRMM